MRPITESKHISEIIKEFRAAHDLTQKELAVALKVNRSVTICDWECGRQEPPPYLGFALKHLEILMKFPKYKDGLKK